MQAAWLIRHGETEWSRDGRHTSHTDLSLTDSGRQAAVELGASLAGVHFESVFSSPRQRALETARLAGFPDPIVFDELAEWDYGEYEGATTAAIRQTVPGWTVWTHPSPGGETAADMGARLDRVLQRLVEVDGVCLVFGHSHALRALAARWIGEDVARGRSFRLDTATISVLAWEREVPVIERWNCSRIHCLDEGLR
jgi:broad specificity phosphatase PhoE